MNLLTWLSDLFRDLHIEPSPNIASEFGDECQNSGANGFLVNPASGLPMVAGTLHDVAGNPFGSDLLSDHSRFEHLHADSGFLSSSDWHSRKDW